VPNYQLEAVILRGLRATIVLTVLSMLIGVTLGVVLAVARLSPNPVLRTVSWVYIWFFRGTPVLVQIIFWGNIGILFQNVSFGIPFTDVTFFSQPINEVITLFVAGLLALGLNEGAYMAEIVRAGIIAVDPGQSEAAHALGMTSGQTMRRIVLPQAMRVIVPPTGNEFISMLKTSALVSVISGGELLTFAGNIYSRNFLVLELLVVASIWYLVLTTLASIGQYYIERYYARGSRDLGETPLQRLRLALTTGPRI
jgi:polar amino acid transport system permease protein